MKQKVRDQPVMDLTDDQINLLQAFINGFPSNEFEAMEIIPESYREYFSGPQTHGKIFKKAVEHSKFANVKLGRFDMNSKHYFYNKIEIL